MGFFGEAVSPATIFEGTTIHLVLTQSSRSLKMPTCDSALSAGEHRVIQFGIADWTILAVGTSLKLALYVFCVRLQSKSDSMGALAEDHLNDVFRSATYQGSCLGASAFGIVSM